MVKMLSYHSLLHLHFNATTKPFVYPLEFNPSYSAHHFDSLTIPFSDSARQYRSQIKCG